MARKREEKAQKSAAARRERKSNGKVDNNFVSLKHQLAAMQLTLKEIHGDGNCLFRALGDQLDGAPSTHAQHRADVVAYMREFRHDFEPFVEDDVPFERHLRSLSELGTYGGNDCIVAFARLHKVVVVIHQLNTPLWQICGCDDKKNVKELHISYHNGDHYNSVRRIGDLSNIPPNIKCSVPAADTCPSHLPKVPPSPQSTSPSHSGGGCVDLPPSTPFSVESGEMGNGLSCAGSWHAENDSEEISDAERDVMEHTGCQDMSVIRYYLQVYQYNMRAVIDVVIQYQICQHNDGNAPYNSLWGPNGTGTRLFGDNTTSDLLKKSVQEKLEAKLKNYQHLSNSKRKLLRKQQRKQESNERKRNGDGDSVSLQSDESSEIILVNDLGCLSL